MVYAIWAFQITAFLIGCTTLLIQLSLIRELALVFTGNELFLGITLAYWVGGVGFGAGWFPNKLFPSSWYIHPKSLFHLTWINALCFPLSLLLIRICYHSMGAQGLEPGITTLFSIPALIVLPPAILNGLWYAVLLANAETTYTRMDKKKRFYPGHFFASEAFGACGAGMFYTFFLAFCWNAFQLAGALLLLLIVHSIFILKIPNQQRPSNWILVGKLLSVFFLLLMLLSGFWNTLDKASMAWYPFPQQQLVNKHTARGHIAVVEQKQTYSYYASGKLLYSFPDYQNNEFYVLLPLLLAPDAKTIALSSDNPETILKFASLDQITKIDLYLEDQIAHRQFSAALSKAWNEVFQNDKLTIYYGDLRQHIIQQDTRYDIILLTVSPPHTLASNRYYTREGMEHLKSQLSSTGIVLYDLPPVSNRTNSAEINLLRSLINTSQTTFPYTRILPTQRLFLCASVNINLAEIVPETMQTNFLKWHTDQLHFSSPQIPTLFDQSREDLLLQQLHPIHTAPLNTDQRPISSGLQTWYWLLKNSSLFSFILCIVLVGLLAYSCRFLIRSKFFPTTVFFACLGAVLMTLQISVITAFQAVHGTLWQSIGLLFGCMMAGLAIGALFGRSVTNSLPNRIFAIAVLVILCMLGARGVLFFSNIYVCAGIILVFGGLLGGFLYALITQHASADFAKQSWAADLIGSCWGALLTGTILIPCLGLQAGLLASAALIISVIFFRST
jgi:spermidine synthase